MSYPEYVSRYPARVFFLEGPQGRGGGRNRVLHASAVRPMITCSRVNGKLFPHERLIADGRSLRYFLTKVWCNKREHENCHY